MTNSLFSNIYEGYAYSYPHKHSYRHMPVTMPLKSLWDAEKKDALFLYVHLPFCEMRCGFCNLFTIANPAGNIVDRYLDTLEREAKAVKENIVPEGFGQLAVGGGTPTFLEVHQLEKLFSIIRLVGCEPASIPVSFEMSPATINREKLCLLIDQGVDRASIGIQSFVETELKTLGRPQKNKQAYQALDMLVQYPFESINVDLIYGAAGQTIASWLHSVQEVIKYGVREVFIYPLYVRPLTGISKNEPVAADERFEFYTEAKKLLLSEGYVQISMRMFQKPGESIKQRSYTCQEDGMVGMGAGARSYTRQVHYSSEYAVARQNISSIIEKYINRSHFNDVDYGAVLCADDLQRRYVIKSVLHRSGLQTERYHAIFAHDVITKFPILKELEVHGLACLKDGVLRLTSDGLDYSDAIGPALYSEHVRQLIADFQLL